jgi:hypothetical protein
MSAFRSNIVDVTKREILRTVIDVLHLYLDFASGSTRLNLRRMDEVRDNSSAGPSRTWIPRACDRCRYP